MNRKTLIIFIIAALVSMTGILFAVTRLYSDKAPKTAEGKTSGHFIEDHELIEAVPSDAAMVFCFKDFIDTFCRDIGTRNPEEPE